jgi:hypothetical protein
MNEQVESQMGSKERREVLRKVAPEFIAALESIDPLLAQKAEENPEAALEAMEQAEDTVNTIVVASNK